MVSRSVPTRCRFRLGAGFGLVIGSTSVPRLEVKCCASNIVLDHIKSKVEFVRQGGPDTELHQYTTLHPLLVDQNSRKSDHWSPETEAYWRTYTAGYGNKSFISRVLGWPV